MDTREIRPEMLGYLDGKLIANGLARLAVEQKDPRTLMRLAAQACVGIRESGNNTGPMVKLLQDTVGGPDAWAWCMSFVQTCIAYAEVRTGISSSIVAHEHCITVWDQTPKAMRVKSIPLAGSIVIWRHESTQAGHTGILESCDGDTFRAYEGNTNFKAPGGPVVRDGGGVAYTTRSIRSLGPLRVVGFLKPF